MTNTWFCIIVGAAHLVVSIVGKDVSYNPLLVSNLWLIAAVLVEGKK